MTNKQKLNKEQLKELTYAQRVDYYANLNEEISINNGNSKTGIGCLTLSMPTLTCREDAPCRKNCYCMKGNQKYPSVCGAYHRNWRLWNENPKNFEEQLFYRLKWSGISLFRWHDAGEIPSTEYLAMMFRMAEAHPQISFLAYTKKYELVNEFLDEGNKIPKNLTIRFSMWDKDWEVYNPYNLPIAFINFNDKSLNPEIPKNAFVCPGTGETTCSCCRICFNKKVKAVVFHQH